MHALPFIQLKWKWKWMEKPLFLHSRKHSEYLFTVFAYWPHGKLLKPTDRQLLLKFKINYTLWELSGYFSMSCRLTKTLRIQAESIVWLSHCRQFTNILIRVYFVIFHLLEIVKLFRNVMLLDCFYCLKTYSFL